MNRLIRLADFRNSDRSPTGASVAVERYVLVGCSS